MSLNTLLYLNFVAINKKLAKVNNFVKIKNHLKIFITLFTFNLFLVTKNLE